MEIELCIRHSGQNWIAENQSLKAVAPTLEELDSQLKSLLEEKKLLKPGGKARLCMYYDNGTIPQWIRPYANHYFNRILELEG